MERIKFLGGSMEAKRESMDDLPLSFFLVLRSF